MDKTEMLGYVVSFLGNDVDASKAELLINSLTAKVLGYCNQKDIASPKLDGLAYIICDMVISRYRSQNPGSVEAVQTISSISDGDQSISYKTPDSSSLSLSEFSEKEKELLNSWRKLPW